MSKEITIPGETLQPLVDSIHSDTPEGYRDFYELIHDKDIPDHAYEWIIQLYDAHERGKRFGLEAFRGSTKTTTLTETFTAYRIGLEPQESNLFVQASDKDAQRHVSNIASIISENPFWKIMFPNVVPDKEKGWGASGYWVKDTSMSYAEWVVRRDMDPTLMAGTYKSGAILGNHPTGVLIIDDINNQDNTESARENERVNTVLSDTLFPAARRTKWPIFVQTPWTEKDALAYAKETGIFEFTKTPVMEIATEDTGEWLEVRASNGTVMYSNWVVPTWPEYFGVDIIADAYRESGHIGFARMYMCDLEMGKGTVL